MKEIAEFVYSKNIIERNAEMIAFLLQLYYFEEELEDSGREKLKHIHDLAELDRIS